MKKTTRKSPAGHRLTMNLHRRLPFSREEYERRYDTVLENMERAGVDALLVRSPENITYLSGYETPGYYGYHCLIIARGQQPVLVGRRLEIETNGAGVLVAHPARAGPGPSRTGGAHGQDRRQDGALTLPPRGGEERLVLHG